MEGGRAGVSAPFNRRRNRCHAGESVACDHRQVGTREVSVFKDSNIQTLKVPEHGRCTRPLTHKAGWKKVGRHSVASGSFLVGSQVGSGDSQWGMGGCCSFSMPLSTGPPSSLLPPESLKLNLLLACRPCLLHALSGPWEALLVDDTPQSTMWPGFKSALAKNSFRCSHLDCYSSCLCLGFSHCRMGILFIKGGPQKFL